MPRQRQTPRQRQPDFATAGISSKIMDLERKRESLKLKLNRFHSLVNLMQDSVPSSSKLIELETRLKDLETSLLSEYNDIQFELEGIDFEQFKEDSEYSFETLYYEVISLAKDFIFNLSKLPQNADNNTQKTSTSHNSSKSINVRFPVIELPKFSGNYNNWLEFKELFTSLIHNVDSLDLVQKFHYLRASLEGSAAHCIQCIEISGSNYDLAWNILCERFDNKRLMIHNHIKQLFNIPELKPDSSFALRNIVDTLSKTLRSLETIGVKTDCWDPLIIYIVTNRFDSETIREWEQYKTKDELPTIAELKTFLTLRADFLEKFNVHKFKPKVINKAQEKRFSGNAVTPKRFQASNDQKYKYSCYYCNKPHAIFRCKDFSLLSLKDKKEQVNSLKLCSNCLQKGHEVNDCKHGSCRYCGARHNSLLHPLSIESTSTGVPIFDQGQSLDHSSILEQAVETIETTTCNASLQGQVLLATALVEVVDVQGKVHVCRALLDSGSMSNFITKNLANKLQLPQDKVDISVSGLVETRAHVSKACDIQVKSLHSSFKTKFRCLILTQITDKLPIMSFDPKLCTIPHNIQLADPKFYESKQIDILIGAGVFWNLLCQGTKQLGLNMPVLQESKLGWYISGPIAIDTRQKKVSCHYSKNLDVQNQLAKFWSLEEVSSVKLFSEEEKQAEQHFQETFKRNHEGRFVVSIPLKDSPSKLGNSRQNATKQFYSLERRLASNPKLKDMYTDFLCEYSDLNHMSPYQPSSDQACFFSPHHGVLREDSTTTKLRVVFNSSFPSSSGHSYNSLQMVGPTVQEDLLSILIRFRQHSYVVSADVCKMYRQILVDDKYKPLQLILWRSSPEKELQSYSLNTVVYGTASAPFLATRCLLQLSIDHQESHPQASEVIRRDFYVDDLLSGANSVQESVDICQQVSSILHSSGFELRKWKSNSLDVLEQIDLSSDSNDKFYFCQQDTSKTLGMLWSCKNDNLSFYIGMFSPAKRLTKRIVLSDTAKIYDPLGLLSPVVIRAKVFLQKLWLLNLGWDQELPHEFVNKWLFFRSELPALNSLKIDRQATCKDLIRVELHGFSDASQDAYGACIYLRTVDCNHKVHVHLLSSKSRVAPLKIISIPRLELCAALLLAQLYVKVKSSLTLNFDDVNLWCDSSVALAWIRTMSHHFQVFVANRVSEIQKLASPELWRYVPTAENPADYISRGISPIAFINTDNWFKGPPWLSKSLNYWPIDITVSKPISILELPEVRKGTHESTHTLHGKIQETIELFPFKRFSSFIRIKHVMAYCIRFVNNCKVSQGQRKCQKLTIEEIRNATNMLVKIAQQEAFASDFKELVKHGVVSNKSNLLSFTPILVDQIIRVGGRLKHSFYPFEKRHPALLPQKHHLTYLIFKSKHTELFHCGPQLLLSSIRETYWPIAGKNLAKRVVHECIVCFRFKPRFIYPLMGNLPESRVCPKSPFSDVGIDYAGPFQYKDRKGRGGKFLKCYLCLFVCLTVKAIHLELVTDLSTAAFLEAFQRFIARRGKPVNVFSDNGSNFIGTNNLLTELGQFLKSSKNTITQQLGDDLNIKWHFISSYSPHHGGIWEAGIKSAKQLLLKALACSSNNFTFESFYTIVSQIENILNSRPLTPLSTDPNDFCALTPSHFLIGRASVNLPYSDLETTPTNRLSHFEQLERVKQHFWRRWSSEYITQLQQRHKWKTNHSNLSIGDLVLIHDNDLPPFKWRLGRISAVHPGTDGVVRVASVKTATGVIKRAVVKLAPLPKDS